MKRILFWLFALAVVAGICYATQYPDEFRGHINRWLSELKNEGPESDSTTGMPTADRAKAERHSAKPRKKVPKKLKPSPYEKLDAYARNTPAGHEKDIQTLAAYLKKPAHTELEKARLVYTWVATHIRYDDEGYNTGNSIQDDFSPEDVLKHRQAVCQGYSELFKALALAMGLEAEVVTGYAKGYSYRPGDKFTETNHAWNAVKIKGAWKLFDATWGSGAGENVNGKLVSKMEFDPIWFATEPKIFIYTHLPEEQKWQSLADPITLEKYENIPEVHPYIFENGFSEDEVFSSIISGKIKKLPDAYATGFPIVRNNFPLMASLQKDREYTFKFESEYLEEAAIVNGTEWLYFVKDGNSFSITFTPTSDKVSVLGKVNWFDEIFKTYVIYKTEEPGEPLASL